MAFVTGSAGNFADLQTALINACTANGWAWDATSSVLSKGNVFVKLTVSNPTTASLTILGGTGISAGALQGASGTPALMYAACATPITWPVTYYILIGANPDSVVLFINHSVNFWQWMIFGQGINLGVPGLATYFGASLRASIQSAPRLSVNQQANAGTGSYPNHASIPFWGPDVAVGALYQNCFAHINFEGCTWGNDGGLNGGPLRADWAANTLMFLQPNAWNSDSMLLPLRVFGSRPSGFYSPIIELPNIRLVRNTNYSDGDIVTLGADRWRIFPGRSKNTLVPNGDANADHSGTYALAVHYDGP
jgi:hypothetical protein